MTKEELDALYARVFATPDGKLVLDHLQTIGRQGTVRIVNQRLKRARQSWQQGACSV